LAEAFAKGGGQVESNKYRRLPVPFPTPPSGAKTTTSAFVACEKGNKGLEIAANNNDIFLHSSAQDSFTHA